ncbi:MAG: TerC family protein [Planctomycetia bacterium]|nr:TerC family protein [Planctomycetia bacterium]
MIWVWIGFIALVLLLLALDLGVFHRHSHVMTVREALVWSGVWITLGVSFSVFIYFGYENHWLGLGNEVDQIDHKANDGASAVAKYLTGYVLEKSLSVDNIFVIAMLFGFFAVPAIYQHRVLYWGILGALLMRGGMIALGKQLITQFHWVLYVFGVFLIFTAFKMVVMKTDEMDPAQNWLVRLARRWFPVTSRYHGERFLVRAGSDASHRAATPGAEVVRDDAVERARPGALMLTPLALALIVIEATDLLFAVDSIPAIFAITTDTFLVFTSNVFAILGLRSLYFALAGMLRAFRYLKYSLAMILALVGVKMLLGEQLDRLVGHHASFYLLGLIVVALVAGVLASWIADKRDAKMDAKSAGDKP